nr:MAG TPA: hypothetical protein [Caudoviricetes sp.]
MCWSYSVTFLDKHHFIPHNISKGNSGAPEGNPRGLAYLRRSEAFLFYKKEHL